MLQISYKQDDFDESVLIPAGYRGRDDTSSVGVGSTRHFHYEPNGVHITYPYENGQVCLKCERSPNGRLSFVAEASEDASMATLVGALRSAAAAHRYGRNQLLMSCPSFPGVSMIVSVGEDNHVCDGWPDLGVEEDSQVGLFAGLLQEFCAQFPASQWNRQNMLGLTVVPEALRKTHGYIRISLSPVRNMPGYC